MKTITYSKVIPVREKYDVIVRHLRWPWLMWHTGMQ